LSPEATIQIVALATNKWTFVTKPRRWQTDSEPAWSPDGRTIAFARTRAGGPTLFLVNPQGSRLRRLTRGRSPTWSPDGKRLAFILGRNIYVIASDGSGRRRVVAGLRPALYGQTFVRWSPDGSKLLYSSGADAWVTDTDGMHRTRLVHGRRGVQGIAWRPG
jgi:TolB protein